MKSFYLLLVTLIFVFSCTKKEMSEPDPYALPWKTEFISFENCSNCCGSHSSGYRLFYKDKVIRAECKQFGSYSITKSLRINDSIQLLFEGNEYFSGTILQTFNGGLSWQATNFPCAAYSPFFHFVNPLLSYCVTKDTRYDSNKSGSTFLISGIGASNLACYRDSFSIGTNYISDLGTDIVGLDSTTIVYDEKYTFIIKFK